ncbi:hypothetical protein BaRGS_00005098 [Batillaria attramentaria]|uniref:Uncharacterized protein n=1 Tax=Batillaria attramentaria TaxID=370345 RepID=A0ABD0LWY5_9CAEN
MQFLTTPSLQYRVSKEYDMYPACLSMQTPARCVLTVKWRPAVGITPVLFLLSFASITKEHYQHSPSLLPLPLALPTSSQASIQEGLSRL